MRGHAIFASRAPLGWNSTFLRALAFCAVLAAFTPWSAAQRMASPAHTAVANHATAPHLHIPANFAFNRNARPFRSRRSPYISPYTSLPFPFFGDSLDPDDIYSTGYPVASEPPPFLMQALQNMAGPAAGMGPAMSRPNNRETSSDPLMIELQNGRYVRVNSVAVDGEALPLTLPENTKPGPSSRSRSMKLAASDAPQLPLIAAASPGPALPPAVLVFRDGHSEEVRDYTIADGILYARGDYFSDGYWNKKIDLANLNVADTLRANTSRNVKFVLPSSPNEVITRP